MGGDSEPEPTAAIGRHTGRHAGRQAGRQTAPGLGFAGLATVVGVVLLVLLSLQRSLRLPSAFGIEDLLGWSSPAVIQAAVRVWCLNDGGGWAAALAYLLVDTGLFIACYGAGFLVLLRHVRRLLASREALLGRVCRIGLGVPAWLALLVLVGIDLFENFGGIRRLDAPPLLYWLALLVTAPLAAALWTLATPAVRELRKPAWWLAGAAVAVVVVLIAAGHALRPDCLLERFDPSAPFAAAHRWKTPAMLAVAAFPVIGYAVWWFGAGFDVERQGREREAQAATRAGIAGIVGRSRYVLLSLAAFALLLLALDQARDVTLALGDFGAIFDPTSRDPESPGMVARAVWQAIVLTCSALSLVILSYSCWLWTRLAGMIQRPGLRLAPGHHEATGETFAFARSWARLLATVPLAIICILVAFAVGDAALAARRAGTGLAWFANMLTLVGFAGITVVIGITLITRRRRRQMQEHAYYNTAASIRDLIWNGTGAGASGPGPAGPRPGPLAAAWEQASRPVWLPLIALVLMAGLRGATLLFPSVTASVPSGLAILTLALAWWLGVLGVLSLFEQRHGAPYVLLPVVWIGLFAWLGVTDTHRLDWAGSLALPSAFHRLAVLTMLVSACLLAWAAAVFPSGRLARLPLLGRLAQATTAGRWLAAMTGFAVALAVLAGLEPDPVPQSADAPTAPATVASTEREPILVAAEGGGMRSAYWTAMALAAVDEEDHGFGGRVALMSGVSGGSLGIAVYRACLPEGPAAATDDAARHGGDAGRPTVKACVRRTLAGVDGLTPLLAGLLFDDVIARLLPTGWSCARPGCGYLSRALGFEQEWIRAQPALATALSTVGRHGPPLAFNATWVESGNRTVVSTLPTDMPFPSATRLQDCLPGQPSLIAAAHASARFPYVNPLATVEPTGSSSSVGCASAGHLIDGGYFDNSGTVTLLDGLRWLRQQRPDAVAVTAILIRNGKPEPGCELGFVEPRQPAADCFLQKVTEAPGAAPADDATLAARLEAPLDRRRWNFYVNELGPLTTLLNVSGIGAQGRHAPAQFSRALLPVRPDDPPRRLRLIEQIDSGELVPTGWYLSPQARRSLDAQLCQVIGRCDR